MQTPGELLKKGLAQLEIPYTEKQVDSFLIYLSELRKWNRAYNLTSLKTDKEIIIKHFLDSLLFLKVLPDDVHSAADVGSGAGFPGVPVKIMMPDIKMFLIEPTQKKAQFLKHIKRALDLPGIEIMDKRIEEVEGLRVDVAMTRALFTVGDFIKQAERILGENGVLILNKGPKVGDELKGLDMTRIDVRDFQLPFVNAVRKLVVVRHS
jgi:16S rRNA (guanine527-N7)-methyltransferase